MDLEAMLADLRSMAAALWDQTARGPPVDEVLGEFAALLVEYLRRYLDGEFDGWAADLAANGVALPAGRREDAERAAAIVSAVDAASPTVAPDVRPLLRLVLGGSTFVRFGGRARRSSRRMIDHPGQLYLFPSAVA